jgi:xanthine/uracil/vitamin C permease (AzgA family)
MLRRDEVKKFFRFESLGTNYRAEVLGGGHNSFDEFHLQYRVRNDRWFVLYPLFKIVSGKARELSIGTWILLAVSVLLFFFYPYRRI